jgi:hypothetical protein
MPTKRKVRRNSSTTTLRNTQKKLKQVKKTLLQCVSSIDKSLSEKQTATKIARKMDAARKRKGWVAGASPNLIPDFAR